MGVHSESILPDMEYFFLEKTVFPLDIIVNVYFFSDLKFQYFCEHYPEILLQVSLK